MHDNDGKSFAAAIDARTGKQLWRVERDLLVEGHDVGLVDALRLETRRPHRARRHRHARTPCRTRRRPARSCGACGGLTGQSTPTPVAADGLLYLATGSQGESNRPVFAVRPGASGDITLAKGEESNAFVAWFHPRASAYTSSPLVYRGRMYVVNDNGILTVFDAQTGKEIYKARAGGSGNTFSASPWAADGKSLSAERRRPHVRHRGRRQVRGAGEEQHGRDELRLARARARHHVPAHADAACIASETQPGAQLHGSRRARARNDAELGGAEGGPGR